MLFRHKRKQGAKTCPYCKKSISNSAFKCTRCNRWVPCALFDRLSDSDIALIKESDLLPMTPSLLTVMWLGLIEEMALDSSMEKALGGRLSDLQAYRVRVFQSYCYYEAACRSARIKRGCRDSIMAVLRSTLLSVIAESSAKAWKRARVGQRDLIELLTQIGEDTYAKLATVVEGSELGLTGRSASPTVNQMAFSKSLSSIVLGDDHHLVVSMLLYSYLMETLWHTRSQFSRLFLVEDDDFDWQAAV